MFSEQEVEVGRRGGIIVKKRGCRKSEKFSLVKGGETVIQFEFLFYTLSATCRLPVYEITKKIAKLLAICNQTKYNEEKRGGDIYGKNSKCICTC